MWKKVIKVVLWSLLSLFLLLSAGAAVGVYWIFTPERITPTLRNQLESMLSCKTELGSVQMKLFSGYQVFSIEINDVVLRNHIDEAARDTILAAKRGYLEVDWMQWWKHRELDIIKVSLEKPNLYYFVNSKGASNWDIFPVDTTTQAASSEMPFTAAKLPSFEVMGAELRYRDVPAKMDAHIWALDFNLTANWKNDLLEGVLKAKTPGMNVRMDNELFWKLHPLELETQFSFQTAQTTVKFESMQLVSREIRMNLTGEVQGDSLFETWDMKLDAQMYIPNLKNLIARIPESMDDALEGMHISGRGTAKGKVTGVFSSKEMPSVDFYIDVPQMRVIMDDFKDIPVDISQAKIRLYGDLDKLDLLKMDLKSLTAKLLDSEFSGEGRVDRLMDQMHFVGNVTGEMNMAGFSAHFLDTMGYPVQGKIKFDSKMDVSMDAFLKEDWRRMKMEAKADYVDLVANSLMDTLGFRSPAGHLELVLHPEQHAGKEWFMHIKGYTKDGQVEKQGKELARYEHLNIDVRTSNFMDTTKSIEAAVVAKLTEILVPQNALQLAAPPQAMRIPLCSVDMLWTPELSDLNEARIEMLGSDIRMSGQLKHFTSYLLGKEKLWGRLNIVSEQLDLGAFMTLGTAWGVVEDPASKSTNKPTEKTAKDSGEVITGPLMLPNDVDLELKLKVNSILYGMSKWHSMNGAVTLKEGKLLLDKLKLIIPAGEVQLTALYRTPRKNHLFAGFDFHMVKVEIDELIKMIPDVDSIMPMLNSFSGHAEFHMVGETYTDSLYNLKKSTLRGAASIAGQNLVLKDGHAFTEIAKTLKFSKKNKITVDSLSAELTLFKNEVDIFPFQISMDNYKAVITGQHNLDMSFNYHISVTDSPLPFRLGVNVYGTMNDLHFRLAPVRFGYKYRPTQRRAVETEALNLRKMIKSSLE